MVQRMPSGDVVIKRVLNNLVGLQRAIIDADSTLNQSLQRQDLKQIFSQFKSMDQKCLDNYNKVFQSIGGGQGNPDNNCQAVINECKQALNNTNYSDAEKIGWYNLLVFSVNQGNNLLAQYGFIKGNNTVSSLMSECFQMETNHIEAVKYEMLKEVNSMA